MALERVDSATHLDFVGQPAGWSSAAIAATIDGLASLQAVWYRREPELRGMNWIGFERCSTSMAEMTDLWTALADHARSVFCAWADPSIAAIHRRLIAQVGQWWRSLETAPRTLIHNDFNPRNICLRQTPSGPTLCAYDWELATIGAPQRDLAEFLSFVLSPEWGKAEVDTYIERHRHALERESGCSIDRGLWVEGFRCSLYDVLVDRLAMYALIHRIRRQPFLPRVVASWLQLYRLFPLGEDA
jgi:hydroxymethylglutaryl-CoA reductase (NADPH)